MNPMTHLSSESNASAEHESPRRNFLARVLALGATVGFGVLARPVGATSTAIIGQEKDEPWMKRLGGGNRVIIHSHLATDGQAITWARTFLEAQKNAYKRQDEESTVVVGLNGRAIGLLFNDSLWAKYPIAQTIAMTGTQNPNGPQGSDAVAQLTARGVIFLVCQNSLNASGSRFLPEAARSDAAQRAAFAQEAKANLLAGVEVVPAMVVTLQQAQDRGCRYIYAGS